MHLMAEADFKTFYNMLRKKFKLPSLDKMDEAFEISYLEPGPFFLREVVRKMSEHIDFHFKSIDRILQPDVSIWEIRESNAFNDAAKRRIAVLYKKLKFYYRFSDEAIIDGSNGACARFIVSFFEHYPEIRQEMLEIIREMKNTWLKELKEKTDLAYLG